MSCCCFGLRLCAFILVVLLSVPFRGKWAPITTAWGVFSLRIEERLPIKRVATNILNKQSQTADKGWFSSLEVGQGVENSSP
jgi:hypothetical protein